MSGSAGNFDLTVAAWDGSKTVGPALYTSATTYYDGRTQAMEFSNIDLSLVQGENYIAYVTVAGVTNPASSVSVAGSQGNGGLGGGFAFLNSRGADPLTLNYGWYIVYSPDNMQFTADFTSVPEPATLTLVGAGLFALGAARPRKAA